jgi:hypothetical protein
VRQFFIALALTALTTGNCALGRSSTDMTDSIGGLEQHFFMHPYPTETVSARLDRIEKLVLGQTQTGSDEERFKKLKAIVTDVGLYSTQSSPAQGTAPNKIPLQGSVAAVGTEQSKMLTGGATYDETPQMVIAWDKWHHDFALAVQKAFEWQMRNAQGQYNYMNANKSIYKGYKIDFSWVPKSEQVNIQFTVFSDKGPHSGLVAYSTVGSNDPSTTFSGNIVRAIEALKGNTPRSPSKWDPPSFHPGRPTPSLYTHEPFPPDAVVPPFPTGSKRDQVKFDREFTWNMGGNSGFGWIKGDIETVSPQPK